MQRPASRLAAVLLLIGATSVSASARMAPQQAGNVPPTVPTGGSPQTQPAGAVADTVPDELRQARDLVERGGDDHARLVLAAKTLIDAGDLSTLRLVLTGRALKPLSGLLRALEKLDGASIEPLLPEILSAAGSQSVAAVRELAQTDLRYLAASRASAVETCIGWLADPALAAASRSALVDALGESRNLVAVEPLIRALEGPQAAEARVALKQLTGHDPGPHAGVPEWTAFWDESRHFKRDVLLEQALQAQELVHEQLLESMAAEVVRSRIDRMDNDIEKLITGLADDYPDVRLAAAVRLAAHENKTGAAAAVPVLLRRLGHAVLGNGGNAALEGLAIPALESVPLLVPLAAPPAAATDVVLTLETDPGVRAQFVTSVGQVGRGRDDVRTALLAELQTSPYGVVTAAAAAALCTLRDQPSVVAPLLDYLERMPGEENSVTILQAIALNKPIGVIPRLAALAVPEQLPRVRAAAVRALMASENTQLALDRLQQIFLIDTNTDVHFAMAVALGDRVRTLTADAVERTRVVALLGALLDDVAPSVRAEAASALGRTGANAAVALLEKRSAAETEASVVVAIVQALGSLKLQEAVPVIGRIVAQRRSVPLPGLETAAQSALSVLGEQRPPVQWLELAESLAGNEAHSLAAWCYAEVIRRFESRAEARDALALARAGRARELVAAAQPEEALRLLEQLAADNALYPSVVERLALQARACEALSNFGKAADFWSARLELLPEGESSRLATQRSWADALRKAGRNTEALKQLRELVAVDGANNTLLFDLAQVEEQLGQYAEAQTDLDRLLGRLAEQDAGLRVQVQASLDRVRAVLAGNLPAPAAAPAKPAETPAKPAETPAKPADSVPEKESVGPSGQTTPGR